WPTPAMREAMANAVLGDDVYGEDPTVNALEAEAAALLGKEAGLFVVSGTMGNLTAVLTHCGRGDEVILGHQSHIFNYELGSVAAYGGIHPHPLPVQHDGTLALDAIRAALRPKVGHFPTTRLICLENTQGGRWGAPLSAEYIGQVAEIARANDLKLHIDGARLFNAAAALETPARELVADADSVTFCVSKGLSAPVGSVLVGTQAFITHARKTRRSLGGGLRQAGVLAAAGLVAIREMTDRLVEDHANARTLAHGLAQIPGVSIDLNYVRSNMVFFALNDDTPISAESLIERLKDDYNIIVRPYSVEDRSFRLVTHYWITPEHIEQVLAAFRALIRPTITEARAQLASD
ncbi:MAG: aminotransferase class I/II-fold pyridoxal phosphate-dependent enzyme, partial [Chloroflexi bacterium]|nr:aminotransferase class I/II-fold pyridoxal phosphate-dependent enzyme [Chloroflexota bacterium]